MGLPEGHEEAVDVSDAPPAVKENEGASTFLPLEFFDGGEMEQMPDALWEDAEARHHGSHAPCPRTRHCVRGLTHSARALTTALLSVLSSHISHYT